MHQFKAAYEVPVRYAACQLSCDTAVRCMHATLEPGANLGIVCGNIEVGQQLGCVQQGQVSGHHLARNEIPVANNGGGA